MESAQSRPPERIDAGPVVLRRLCQDDAPAIAEALLASMKHLEPWMPWATPTAAEVANQRSRIVQADGLWQAGSDFIFSVLPAGATEAADGPVTGVGVPETGAANGGTVNGSLLFLGTFGLHRRIGPDAIEMGYWIHADHAGRGYGTAAARALTRAALAMPAVARVEIHCDVANAASAAIPRRLGYRLDRVEQREPEAPAETGELMIWVLDGTP